MDSNALSRVMPKIGVKDITPHNFRHLKANNIIRGFIAANENEMNSWEEPTARKQFDGVVKEAASKLGSFQKKRREIRGVARNNVNVVYNAANGADVFFQDPRGRYSEGYRKTNRLSRRYEGNRVRARAADNRGALKNDNPRKRLGVVDIHHAAKH